MHEFRVAPEDFIALPRDPAILFALAIGILGDVSASVADQIRDGIDLHGIQPLPLPLAWGERDPAPQEGLRFASLFFDAFSKCPARRKYNSRILATMRINLLPCR